MARFNTPQTTTSVTGTTTLTYVLDKSTILLTGTSGYTLTLASPAGYNGSIQTIYNNTGGNVTIATPSGNLIGNGFTAATSQTIPDNTTYTVTSNGTHYVITNNQGGPISVTAGTFSSTATFNSTVSMSPANANVTISPSGTGTVTVSPAGGLTLNPGTVSNINNTNVGGTTRGTGAFTTLDANSTVGLSPANNSVTISPTGTGTVTMAPGTAGNINNMNVGASTRGTGSFTSLTANAAVTLTQNTASSSTTTGTLVVDGGVGVSGAVYTGGIVDIANTTASSSTTTGALLVDGGAGIQGAVYAGSLQGTPIGTTSRAAANFTTLDTNSNVNLGGTATLTVGSGVSTTFSGTVVVPDPQADNQAANRNYVLNRVYWNTASSIGTVTTSATRVFSFSLSAATVGTNAITYALQSGALPDGGSLNTSNGTVSGTSTNGFNTSTGYTFTIRASISATIYTDRTFTVTIYVPPPTGQQQYDGSGTNTNGGQTAYTWVAPSGVNTVSVAAIGAGGGGCYVWAYCGGAGGGMVWANGVPVTPGNSYTIQVGNGGCWSGSAGGYSCFPNLIAYGGACGCCSGCYTLGGTYSQGCGSYGGVAYPGTAGGGGGGGGYCNGNVRTANSGYTGCFGGGGSANDHHSSTYGTGGGGGTGICGQGSNGACGNAGYSHQTGSGGQGGSGGTCGKPGEPWSNGQGNGYSCGGYYGGGGGGSGTSHGGGWGGQGAVRIIWGPGRAYPSTLTTNQ